jgi:hypothetical protein
VAEVLGGGEAEASAAEPVEGDALLREGATHGQPTPQVADVPGHAAAAEGALRQRDGVLRREAELPMKEAGHLAEGGAVVHRVGGDHPGREDPLPVGVEDAGALLEGEAQALLGGEAARRADLEQPHRLAPGVGRRHGVAQHLVDGEAEALPAAEGAIGEEHGPLAGGGAGAEARLDAHLDVEAGGPSHRRHEPAQGGTAAPGDGGDLPALLPVGQVREEPRRQASQGHARLAHLHRRAAGAEATGGQRPDQAWLAEDLHHGEFELELVEARLVVRRARQTGGPLAGAIEDAPDGAVDGPAGAEAPARLRHFAGPDLLDEAGPLLDGVGRRQGGQEPSHRGDLAHHGVHLAEGTGDGRSNGDGADARTGRGGATGQGDGS